MDFAGAIKAGFKNIFNFKGVATRPEYWYFLLFNFLVGVFASIIDGMSNSSVLGNLVGFVLFIPMLSLLFRRFRDAGVSPFWLLTYLVPLATTFALVIANFQSILNIASGLENIDINDDQAIVDYLSTNSDFISLIGPFLLALSVWLMFSIFELVITLLPTKKANQPVVATNDY